MISIILPCFNEMRHGFLEQIIENLTNQVGEKEILAVVSPSNDLTESCLRQFDQVNVISTELQNRAQRFDVGIAASKGEIILLHHAATLLPALSALQQIEEILSDDNNLEIWGGFHHSFDHDHWLLRFSSWYSNQVRGKQKGILYFDHCIFVRRAVLAQIGGVGDRPIFADTRLSEKLRALRNPVFSDGMVITSARRFRERGIFRQALMNQMLKLFYHLGVDDRTMNWIYEGKNPINVAHQD